MHELFHIIVHWGDIRSITLFPDASAIVEVIFTPSTSYDLVIEEVMAYTITMVALILTAMLIGDIHDVRDKKSVEQTILSRDFATHHSEVDEQKTLDHLGSLLGISPVMQ